MQEMFIGEVIKQRRKELGLTQEQLCEGICEPITISRMENGKQTPSRNRVIALLQRLGLPDDCYFALLNKNELELDKLQKDVASYSIRYRRASNEEKSKAKEDALAAVKRLEDAIEDDDLISQQIVIRSKILLGKDGGEYSFEEKINMLMESIHLTVPRFDLDEIGACLYSYDEIQIINHIACVYSEFEQHRKAVDIYSQLLKYIQKHMELVPSTKSHLPMIAYNYAHELGILKRYEDSIEIAEIGRQVCINYGYYAILPELIAMLAECKHFLGKDKESMSLYRQSYYIYKAIGNERNIAVVLKDVKQYFGVEIED